MEFRLNNHRVKGYSDKEATSVKLNEERAKLVSDKKVGYLDRRWEESGMRCALLCGWYIVLMRTHIFEHTRDNTHIL